MTNHPNRSDVRAGHSPAPEEVAAARRQAGLTLEAAAALVYTKTRAWQRWEAGDRAMHPALWELFRLKSGQF